MHHFICAYPLGRDNIISKCWSTRHNMEAPGRLVNPFSSSVTGIDYSDTVFRASVTQPTNTMRPVQYLKLSSVFSIPFSMTSLRALQSNICNAYPGLHSTSTPATRSVLSITRHVCE